MYRVSENPRCLASCELISQALLTLINEASFAEVSVSQIAKISTISRTTFYKHFDSPIDVLEWSIKRDVYNSFRGAEFLAERDIAALTELVFRYWVERGDVLLSLENNGLYSIFTSALTDVFKHYFEPIIDRSTISQETKPYLLGIYPVVAASILRTWITTGQKESVEKLISISLHNNTFPI